MLKLFRDNLKSFSWVLWVVIGTFILGFTVLGGLGDPNAGSGPNAPAAWAGDAVVTMAEFQREHRQLVETYRQRLGDSLSAEMVDGLRQQALDSALQGKLLALEARSMGLRVSDDEVREVILEIPWIKDENGAFIGEDRYRRNLRGVGYTSIADFENAVRESLLNQKLNEVLRASIYVTDSEVEEAYRDQIEKAKVRSVTLPTAQVDEVEVSETDLEDHFEAHADDYRLPEQRVANYLLVDNARLRGEVEADPAAVQAYYDQHPDEFTQEEQIRARHILLRTAERTPEEAEAELAGVKTQIEAGRDFAEVAREISEDPGSKDRGGDLSYFGRGRMNQTFEEAAFGASLNEVVGPVATPFGVHLIQVTDRREGGLRPLSEVEPRIRGQLINEQVEALAEERAAELLARLKDEQALTEELGASIAADISWVTFNTTQAFGRQDVVPGVGRSADFATATFDLEPGEMSALIKIPRGWAVVTLKEVQEPRLPALAEVEAQVRQAARSEKLKAAARARLEEARRQIEGGETLDEVAAELGLTVSESAEVGRGGSVHELGEIGSQVAAMALGMSAGEIGGPLENARGATLFEVTERKQWDPAQFEEEKEATRSRVEGQRFFQLLSSMIDRRRLELNAHYNPQLVDAAEADL